MKLSDQSLTPLYQQVMEDIRGRIESGAYPISAKIPSEGELSELYSVSRITIRRAIEELSLEGYLTKKQGKGTFVNPPKITKKIRHSITVPQFEAECRACGREPSCKVISVTREIGSNPVCDRLGIPQTSEVISVLRLRLVDGKPVLVERHFLPFDRFSFLLDRDLECETILDNLTRSLSDAPIEFWDQTVEIVRANETTASYLQTSVGEPLFKESFLCGVGSTPLMTSNVYLLGSLFVFKLS